MIILLTKSKLFTLDPAIRFSKEYQVDKKVFQEMLRRRWLLKYSYNDLREFVEHRTGKRLSNNSIQRWLVRAEIYCRANHVIRMGVRAVDTSYFNEYEDELLELLFKNMKFSGTGDSQTVL